MSLCSKCINTNDFPMSFTLDWSNFKTPSNQTAFAIVDDKTLRGEPNVPNFTIRMTQDTGACPPLLFQSFNSECNKERVKISLSNSLTHEDLSCFKCTAKQKQLKLLKKHPSNMVGENGFVYCDVQHGKIDLSPLVIKCLSTERQHGHPFRLKIEFLSNSSAHFGKHYVSEEIEVRSKPPFTEGRDREVDPNPSFAKKRKSRSRVIGNSRKFKTQRKNLEVSNCDIEDLGPLVYIPPNVALKRIMSEQENPEGSSDELERILLENFCEVSSENDSVMQNRFEWFDELGDIVDLESLCEQL